MKTSIKRNRNAACYEESRYLLWLWGPYHIFLRLSPVGFIQLSLHSSDTALPIEKEDKEWEEEEEEKREDAEEERRGGKGGKNSPSEKVQIYFLRK